MKKVLYNILLFLIILFPVNVFAEGYISVSPTSITITEGSSKNVTITAYNAIGDVEIKSNNTSIATVNTKSWGTGMVGEKETKKGSITVTGKSVGKTTITFIVDAATFDNKDLSGKTETVTVNVIKKETPKPKPTPTPTPTPKPAPKPESNLSNNNNLKSISVDGYSLNKVDNNNYTLDVPYNTDSINIKVDAEDSKAKVSGDGDVNLKVGVNNITVVITSESKKENKINIKVTRKDGYYLNDLSNLIKDDKLKQFDITLKPDDKVLMSDLEKLKEKKKELNLNYYDDAKKLIYSWNINVSDLKDVSDFSPMITFDSENKKAIDKASNYAQGMYVNFKHSGKLPVGTKIKINVLDKFENESYVNVYYYNKDKKLELVKSRIKVEDGYVVFYIDHCSEYFITMSNVVESEPYISVAPDKDEPVNIFMIFTIVELVVILGLVIFIFTKLNKLNKPKEENKQPEIQNIE